MPLLLVTDAFEYQEPLKGLSLHAPNYLSEQGWAVAASALSFG